MFPIRRMLCRRLRHLSTTIPRSTTPTLILGIETSCDDTGVAIVDSTGHIVFEALSSQDATHLTYGGIVPKLAKRDHEINLPRLLDQAETAIGSFDHLDGIAATAGPGLALCLRVGYRAGRELAHHRNLPFVAVNHLEAHVLVPRLEHTLEFPFLALLVSGGHCMLLLTRGVNDHVRLGTTHDDSLGEAYDKVARMLDLDMKGGGGAALERLALEGDEDSIPFPTPLRRRKDCMFSFSGLKTAVYLACQKLSAKGGVGGEGEGEGEGRSSDRANVEKKLQLNQEQMEENLNRLQVWKEKKNSGPKKLQKKEALAFWKKINDEYKSYKLQKKYLLDKNKKYHQQMEEITARQVGMNRQDRANVAASFQKAARLHLQQRLKYALEWCDEQVDQGTLACAPTSVVVTGGVASNQYLRDHLSAVVDERNESNATCSTEICFPPLRLCTDNGVMVAWTGHERMAVGLLDDATPPLDGMEDFKTRWPLGGDRVKNKKGRVLLDQPVL
jgi:N6-L-threonylcarbamoyladenine synthase